METIDINSTWEKVLVLLKDKISEPTYSTWIVPLVPHCFNENEFCVLTAHNLSIQIINRSCHDTIVKVLSKEIGKNVTFRIIYSKELEEQQKKQAKKEKNEDFIKNLENKIVPSKYDGLKQMRSSCNLNLKYKFDNFVVGSNNNFAYHAAYAVAQNPGVKFNPLFIYGGSGLGKTHLLQAIGHEILYNSKLKVKYIKTEEFINDLVDSMAKSKGKSAERNSYMVKFREKYRTVDVLLIDDIQLIEGKKGTQNEIFNTFDALYNSGKQIVITSDRPPESFEDTMERLTTRFSQGLMVDVQVPDIETRMAILKKLSDNANLNMPSDVIEFLAQVYSKNIRELEGAFNKVSAFSEINNVKITLDSVKKIINYNPNRKVNTLQGILDSVCSFYNISSDDIKGTCRMANIVKARQVAMYLSKELTSESLNSIGEFLKRKHTTVLYSYDEIKDKIKHDLSFSNEIAELIKIINN